MNDLMQMAQQITALLKPYIPDLLKAGAMAVGAESGKQIVATIWEKLKGKPHVLEAAKEVAEDPNDEDSLEILTRYIKRALKEDLELQAELTKLLPQIGVQASGERSVAIGGAVNNATIVTGDGNVIGSNNKQYNINAEKIIGSAIGDGNKVITERQSDD